ncbi:MAG: hypothetical protein CL626_08200 [Aurantimonas sp.]|nr:hypothetical protein [Aurantimonas sp.]
MEGSFRRIQGLFAEGSIRDKVYVLSGLLESIIKSAKDFIGVVIGDPLGSAQNIKSIAADLTLNASVALQEAYRMRMNDIIVPDINLRVSGVVSSVNAEWEESLTQDCMREINVLKQIYLGQTATLPFYRRWERLMESVLFNREINNGTHRIKLSTVEKIEEVDSENESSADESASHLLHIRFTYEDVSKVIQIRKEVYDDVVDKLYQEILCSSQENRTSDLVINLRSAKGVFSAYRTQVKSDGSLNFT